MAYRVPRCRKKGDVVVVGVFTLNCDKSAARKWRLQAEDGSFVRAKVGWKGGIESKLQLSGLHVVAGVRKQFHVRTVVPVEMCEKNRGDRLGRNARTAHELLVDPSTGRLKAFVVPLVGPCRLTHAGVHQQVFLSVSQVPGRRRYIHLLADPSSHRAIRSPIQGDRAGIQGNNLISHLSSNYVTNPRLTNFSKAVPELLYTSKTTSFPPTRELLSALTLDGNGSFGRHQILQPLQVFGPKRQFAFFDLLDDLSDLIVGWCWNPGLAAFGSD